MNGSDQLLTVFEAAEMLGVKPNTLRGWLKAGVLAALPKPYEKSVWRIPRAEVERLLTPSRHGRPLVGAGSRIEDEGGSR